MDGESEVSSLELDTRSALSLNYLSFGDRPNSIDTMQALGLAVVFEDLDDSLDIIGRSISGPTVQEIDLRTIESIVYDKDHHRPVEYCKQKMRRRSLTDSSFLDLRHSDRLWGELGITPEKSYEAGVETLEDANKRSDGGTKEVFWRLKQHYNTVMPRRMRDIYLEEAAPTPNKIKFPTRKKPKPSLDGREDREAAWQKAQEHRTEIQAICRDVVKALCVDCSYDPLVKSVADLTAQEEEKKTKLIKMREDKMYITETKIMLNKLRAEREALASEPDPALFNILCEYEESRVRRGFEEKYVSKSGKAKVWSNRMVKQKREAVKEDEIADIKQSFYWEDRCHESMMTITKMKFNEVQRLHQYWTEKYDRDFTKLNNALHAMIRARARDLDRIKWLQKFIPQYNDIVADDKRLKALEKLRARRRAMENRRAIKLQAWWRGMLVRNYLGPFKNLMEELMERKREKEAKRKAKKKD